MNQKFIEELKSLLSTSDSKLRKHWAQRIVQEQLPVTSLMSLLHAETKTAQRFTWLIGDLTQTDPSCVEPCLPLLFSLHDQMPFPGMRRSVGKCFYHCGVPKKLEKQAIPVLMRWLDDDEYAIGCKHYASKVLFELAIQSRVDSKKVDRLLEKQSQHSNLAHASRMAKQRIQLKKKLEKMKQR